MMLRFRQLDEVVAIAGHHKAIMLISKLHDCGIRCLQRQHIAEPEDFVVQFSKQVGEIFGDVLIEQELHGWSGASAI